MSSYIYNTLASSAKSVKDSANAFVSKASSSLTSISNKINSFSSASIQNAATATLASASSFLRSYNPFVAQRVQPDSNYLRLPVFSSPFLHRGGMFLQEQVHFPLALALPDPEVNGAQEPAPEAPVEQVSTGGSFAPVGLANDAPSRLNKFSGSSFSLTQKVAQSNESHDFSVKEQDIFFSSSVYALSQAASKSSVMQMPAKGSNPSSQGYVSAALMQPSETKTLAPECTEIKGAEPYKERSLDSSNTNVPSVLEEQVLKQMAAQRSSPLDLLLQLELTNPSQSRYQKNSGQPAISPIWTLSLTQALIGKVDSSQKAPPQTVSDAQASKKFLKSLSSSRSNPLSGHAGLFHAISSFAPSLYSFAFLQSQPEAKKEFIHFDPIEPAPARSYEMVDEKKSLLSRKAPLIADGKAPSFSQRTLEEGRKRSDSIDVDFSELREVEIEPKDSSYKKNRGDGESIAQIKVQPFKEEQERVREQGVLRAQEKESSRMAMQQMVQEEAARRREEADARRFRAESQPKEREREENPRKRFRSPFFVRKNKFLVNGTIHFS